MSEHESYIALRPCGCFCCVVVDDPARARETAKDVADWIRRGLTVRRVTTAEVRAMGCEICRPSKEAGVESVRQGELAL